MKQKLLSAFIVISVMTQLSLEVTLAQTYITKYGSNSLVANTTGDNNSGFGALTLRYNTSGSGNTAVGTSSLQNNISGNGNTGIGFNALFNNRDSDNTAVGNSAMINNNSGYRNTAIGSGAMFYGVSSINNVAVGYSAMEQNTTGGNNVAVGAAAIWNITTGSRNVAVGHSAGGCVSTGLNNTFIGYYANAVSGTSTCITGISNAIALGSNTHVDASNKVRIGNTSVSSIGGQVNWTNFSDGRIKRNIQENVPGLVFIRELRPVTYQFDVKKQNELMGVMDQEDWEGKYEIEKITFTGFVAQEVEAAAAKVNYDFSGVDKSGELIGLRYSEFVMPLVKSVQELEAMLKVKEELLVTQQRQIDDLKKQMQQIDQSLSQIGLSFNSESKLSAISPEMPKLEQNAPNPFSQKTIIRYFIPQASRTAIVKIHSLDGTELLSLPVIGKGIGEVTVEGHSLPSGVYVYTLFVDGNAVDTKQMIRTK